MKLHQLLAALLLVSIASGAQAANYFAPCQFQPCNIQLTDPSSYDTTVPMTVTVQAQINTYHSLNNAMAVNHAQVGDSLVLCTQFGCAYYAIQAGGKFNRTLKLNHDGTTDLTGGVDVIPAHTAPTGYISGGPSKAGGCAVAHVSVHSDPNDPESPMVTVDETVCWSNT